MTLPPAWLLLLFAAFVAGALVGLLVTSRTARRREAGAAGELARLQAELAAEQARGGERARALEDAEKVLAGTFARLANESLSQQSEAFLRLAQENLGRFQDKARADLDERAKTVATLLAPIREALEKTSTQIGAIEKERHEAFGGIRAQLAAMSTDQQLLQTETRNLVNALRRPQVRGQWGELTLRRVAELAGMVEHCDFVEQETIATAGGNLRPDMIVRLPDRGELVVDVKTPLDAYLEAIEAASDQDRRTALQRHARNVAERVRELSAKAYWAQFPSSPAFVVLFIPGDQFLAAALSENPGLLEEALRNKVVLATPTSLVALLQAVAFGWRQLSLQQNAEEIRRVGQELYERLAPFMAHLARLGRQFESSIKTYNEAVGSLERKVLPGARRLTELGIRGKHDIEAPTGIETTARIPTTTAAEPAEPPASDSANSADDQPLPH